MAMLPSPGDLSRRAPSGSTRIAQVQTGGVERATANAAGAEGERARAVGSMVSNFGDNVAKLAEQEKQRLDDAQFQEYRNKAVDKSVARLTEAQAVQGTGVLKGDYIKAQLGNLDKDHEDLLSTLSNDSQKAKAKSWYDQFRTTFGREVTMHAVRETEKAEQSNFEGSVKSWLKYGTSAPTNSDITVTAVEGIRNAVINKLTKAGADPLEIGAQALMAAGNAHKQIIDTLRAQGNITYANQYLKDNIDDMSPEQATAAKESLRRITEYEQGAAVGQQAYDIIAAGGTPADADKFLKSQKLSAEALSTAKSAMRDSVIAAKETNDETKGELFMQFRGTDKSTAAMGAIMRSDAFMKLPKEEQEAVSLHLDAVRRAADADADEARREAEDRRSNSPKSIALIGELLDDPDKLVGMSNARITALEPTIGNANVVKLLGVKNGILKGASRFNVPPALVNEALANVKSKEDQKVLRGAIAMKLMEFKEQNPGKEPTPEQQADIVRAGQETFIDTTAWFDKEEPAYKVKPGKGFPLDFKQRYPDLDDDEVLAKYNQFVVLYDTVRADAKAKRKTPPSREKVLEVFTKAKTSSVQK